MLHRRLGLSLVRDAVGATAIRPYQAFASRAQNRVVRDARPGPVERARNHLERLDGKYSVDYWFSVGGGVMVQPNVVRDENSANMNRFQRNGRLSGKWLGQLTPCRIPFSRSDSLKTAPRNVLTEQVVTDTMPTATFKYRCRTTSEL